MESDIDKRRAGTESQHTRNRMRVQARVPYSQYKMPTLLSADLRAPALLPLRELLGPLSFGFGCGLIGG